MEKQMNPLGSSDGKIVYETDKKGQASIEINNLSKVLHQNLIFDQSEINWYQRFNRYGWIDLYNTDQICKEYLFFTKPDLFIFDTTDYASASKDTLNKSLIEIPFFNEAAIRHKPVLAQLQYSLKDPNGVKNPFMCILSNAVTGKMDLPGISADMQQATPNIYGVSLDYRSNSIKSDYAFDFSLSFADTAYLEIYTMVKAYDEYMRMIKMGEIKLDKKSNFSNSIYDTYKQYVIDRIIPEQFSVYKFLTGSDGETLLYYAKATGVYFTDVPRSDFGDPGNSGFNYSLSFHANFIEDNNPMIIKEFNTITRGAETNFITVHDSDGVNNEWAAYPVIETVKASQGDKRVIRRGTVMDYRLKWTNSVKNDDTTDKNANNESSDLYSYNSAPVVREDGTAASSARTFSGTAASSAVYRGGTMRINQLNSNTVAKYVNL